MLIFYLNLKYLKRIKYLRLFAYEINIIVSGEIIGEGNE
jgi:hypothetical protein